MAGHDANMPELICVTKSSLPLRSLPPHAAQCVISCLTLCHLELTSAGSATRCTVVLRKGGKGLALVPWAPGPTFASAGSG